MSLRLDQAARSLYLGEFLAAVALSAGCSLAACLSLLTLRSRTAVAGTPAA